MSEISPEKRARLVALADAHDEWVEEKLTDGVVPFEPAGRKPGSDYNQHHIDLEADDDEFHRRAKHALGMS